MSFRRVRYSIGRNPRVFIARNMMNHVRCPFLAAFQIAIAFQVSVQINSGYIQNGRLL